ncbi:hypothetical protein HAX54_047345, partial [Datura stramonium]|nr:hypothetical protein [Datura stramonium]
MRELCLTTFMVENSKLELKTLHLFTPTYVYPPAKFEANAKYVVFIKCGRRIRKYNSCGGQFERQVLKPERLKPKLPAGKIWMTITPEQRE